MMESSNVYDSRFFSFDGRVMEKTAGYAIEVPTVEFPLHLYRLTLEPNAEIHLSGIIRDSGVDYACGCYMVFSGHAHLYVNGDERKIDAGHVCMINGKSDQRLFNDGRDKLILAYLVS